MYGREELVFFSLYKENQNYFLLLSGLLVLTHSVAFLPVIRYEDDHIMIKQGCRLSSLTAPVLKRDDYQGVYDVRIRSEDGKELRAHKCVLVARLDYFRNMLSGRWVEVSDLLMHVKLTQSHFYFYFLYALALGFRMWSSDTYYVIQYVVDMF
jgi:hypothetical protein